MTKMYRVSWKITALILSTTALILSGGLFQLVGAQQTNPPPTYDSDSPPRYQEPALLPRPDYPVVSESAEPPSPSPDAAGPGWSPSSRLQVQNDQGVRYVSGGVGESERAELNNQSQQFNLRLLFAMQGSGEYLSAVRVSILDARGGTVLVTESKGPWFLAQLPPGDYTVEASVPGQTERQPQRQTAHVEDSRQSRLNFYWR
jgi:hypothetical protein